MADLPTRKVLTVNQVFEIMLNWVETRDWEQSLYSVMPKRKFDTVGRHAKNKNKEGQSEDVQGEVVREEDIEGDQDDPEPEQLEFVEEARFVLFSANSTNQADRTPQARRSQA